MIQNSVICNENAGLQAKYNKWYDFMEQNVEFGLKDSELHTKSHCARVLLLTLKIAAEFRLNNEDVETLCHAAIFHDSRRQDDWLDVGHGQRAAEYYRKFCMVHGLTFDERAYQIMAYHDRDDTFGIQQFEKCALKDGILLYQIFKDADALDRFRIGPDALDVNYLRTDPAKRLVEFAKELVQKLSYTQPVLEPNKYLIVVDMQNEFISGCLGTEEARKIVPLVSKKIEAFSGNVLFTMDSHKTDYLSTQEGTLLPVQHCIIGTEGWQLTPEMQEMKELKNGETYMKPVFGSVKMAQDLEQIHKQNAITEIELVGVCTDVCVISNAIILRNMLPEIPIYVDPSCCAGTTTQKHKSALEIMESCQIRLRKEII